MQTSFVKEFEDNPDVVVQIINANDLFDVWEWVDVLWRSHYMRQPFIWEDDGRFLHELTDFFEWFYGAQVNGLPYGRWYILDREGVVFDVGYGYNPGPVVEKVYDLANQ